MRNSIKKLASVFAALALPMSAVPAYADGEPEIKPEFMINGVETSLINKESTNDFSISLPFDFLKDELDNMETSVRFRLYLDSKLFDIPHEETAVDEKEAEKFSFELKAENTLEKTPEGEEEEIAYKQQFGLEDENEPETPEAEEKQEEAEADEEQESEEKEDVESEEPEEKDEELSAEDNTDENEEVADEEIEEEKSEEVLTEEDAESEEAEEEKPFYTVEGGSEGQEVIYSYRQNYLTFDVKGIQKDAEPLLITLHDIDLTEEGKAAEQIMFDLVTDVTVDYSAMKPATAVVESLEDLEKMIKENQGGSFEVNEDGTYTVSFFDTIQTSKNYSETVGISLKPDILINFVDTADPDADLSEQAVFESQLSEQIENLKALGYSIGERSENTISLGHRISDITEGPIKSPITRKVNLIFSGNETMNRTVEQEGTLETITKITKDLVTGEEKKTTIYRTVFEEAKPDEISGWNTTDLLPYSEYPEKKKDDEITVRYVKIPAAVATEDKTELPEKETAKTEKYDKAVVIEKIDKENSEKIETADKKAERKAPVNTASAAPIRAAWIALGGLILLCLLWNEEVDWQINTKK